MPVLVIMNPAAGRGRHRRDPGMVAAALAARGIVHDFHLTERPGHAREILAGHGAGADTVLVVGGDGTVHEVLQGLDLERQRLAVLPWGSGNDFAWMTGAPAGIDLLLDRIESGAERRVDVGTWRAEAGGETRAGRFHNNLGFGFEASVNEASGREGRLKGPLLYLGALLRSLPRYRNHPVILEWDGGGYEGTVALLMVGNGRRVGGAFLLAPHARIDDGRLDLVFAAGMSLPRMLLLLPRTFGGGHLASSRVRFASTPRVGIRCPEGLPAYVDGEFIHRTVRSAEIGLLPRSLRVAGMV